MLTIVGLQTNLGVRDTGDERDSIALLALACRARSVSSNGKVKLLLLLRGSPRLCLLRLLVGIVHCTVVGACTWDRLLLVDMGRGGRKHSVWRNQ